MRFERIDDETLKFYISYDDIENRGFTREELWMDRKRGEEFFWKLMSEVNDEHTKEFMKDGPLWIQVHAFDKGLEVVVSKSQADNRYGLNRPENMKDTELEELIEETFKDDDLDLNDKDEEEQLLEDLYGEEDSKELDRIKEMIQEENKRDYTKPVIAKFDDIDSLIEYSYGKEEDESLYDDLLLSYNDSFYYLVFFTRQGKSQSERIKLNLLEYGERTDKTEAVLMEYGNTIMAYNVRRQLRRNFEASK